MSSSLKGIQKSSNMHRTVPCPSKNSTEVDMFPFSGDSGSLSYLGLVDLGFQGLGAPKLKLP